MKVESWRKLEKWCVLYLKQNGSFKSQKHGMHLILTLFQTPEIKYWHIEFFKRIFYNEVNMWDYLPRWYAWCNCSSENFFGFNKNWLLFGGNIDAWPSNGIKPPKVAWVYKTWFKAPLFTCYCVKWKIIHTCTSLLHLAEVLNALAY